MTRRQITVVLGILSLVVAIIIGNILASGTGEQQINGSSSVVINVPVVNSVSEEVTAFIPFTGKVIPEDRIDLFAEVTGVLLKTSKEFRTGTEFRKGDILIRIDDSEFSRSLMAQRSRFASSLSQVLADISVDYPEETQTWQKYLSDYDATKPIADLPEVQDDKFKLFLTGRAIYSDYFTIKQGENRLTKYTITAPYNGVVTQSSIDSGTLVRVNQMLGEFIKKGSYEIEASVPVDEVQYIKIGDQVNLGIQRNGDTQTLTAKVKRINSAIDGTTQTVLVYLGVQSTDLLAGQFVKGAISGKTFENAQSISRDIMVRDNMIFVIKDSVATLQEVNVLARLSDEIIISALEESLQIIDEFRNPVFEGTKVAGLESN